MNGSVLVALFCVYAFAFHVGCINAHFDRW
jgi:hypothetical protein